MSQGLTTRMRMHEKLLFLTTKQFGNMKFLRRCKFIFFRLTRDDELNKETRHKDILNSTRICYEESGTELTTGATPVDKESTLNTCKHTCRNFDLGV